MVHECDAMGGEIGKMADRCYLQKRVLNRSKVCIGGGGMRGGGVLNRSMGCGVGGLQKRLLNRSRLRIGGGGQQGAGAPSE